MSEMPGELLVALPSPVYRAILQFMPPAVVRLMLDRRVLLCGSADLVERTEGRGSRPAALPELELGHIIEDPFERWLIEKWRRDIASPEFRASAQFEELMAQWEREG